MLTTGTETFILRRGHPRNAEDYLGLPPDVAWHLVFDGKYDDDGIATWMAGEMAGNYSAQQWANHLITKLTYDTVHVTGWEEDPDGDLVAAYQVVSHALSFDCSGRIGVPRTCADLDEAEQVMMLVQTGAGLVEIDGDGDGPEGSEVRRYIAVRNIWRVTHTRTLSDRDAVR